MLHEFNKKVDALPLIGKLAIGPMMKTYIKAEPGRDRMCLASNVLLLATLVVIHAQSAKNGMNTFAHHLDNLEDSGDPGDGLFMAIDAAYVGINAAVSVRQAGLLHTLNKIRNRKKDRVPRTQSAPFYAPMEVLDEMRRIPRKTAMTAIAVTSIGQMIFGFTQDKGIEHSAPIVHSVQSEAFMTVPREASIAELSQNVYANMRAEPVGSNPADPTVTARLPNEYAIAVL